MHDVTLARIILSYFALFAVINFSYRIFVTAIRSVTRASELRDAFSANDAFNFTASHSDTSSASSDARFSFCPWQGTAHEKVFDQEARSYHRKEASVTRITRRTTRGTSRIKTEGVIIQCVSWLATHEWYRLSRHTSLRRWLTIRI